MSEILNKMSLPFSLDYEIAENSVDVSQDEKERILLARLIAHSKDKTVCIITHRTEILKALSKKIIQI